MSPKKILQYSEESMKKALEDVAHGSSILTAAKKWKVPRSTLRSKVMGINPISRKMGRATAFERHEEMMLEHWVLSMTEKGFPLSKASFLYSSQRLAVETDKDFFKEKLPSKKWYKSFMARHPRIAERVCKNLTKCRAAVTQSQLDGWKSEIYSYLQENNLTDILQEPDRVFNADETAFFLNPKGGRVLAERGAKSIYHGIGKDEKECLTVLMNGNASGDLVPPMVIFRYIQIPTFIAENLPCEWAMGKSEQGWMNCELFYEYVANHFIKWLNANKIKRPILFFVDGHVSHLSLETNRLCSDNGIVLIALYPNATHLLQPLDVALFHYLKQAWKEKTLNSRLQNREVKKTNFCLLLHEVLTESYRPEILVNGFRKCGLVPWDPLAVTLISNGHENAFEEKKNPSLGKPSCLKHFIWLQSLMGAEKVKFFKENQEAAIPLRDLSLYKLWRKASLDLAGSEVVMNDH